MCNQCNCNRCNCNSCGSSLLRGLQNLFQCGNCGCGGNGNGNGRGGNGNGGCGCNSCGCSNARSFVNGFNLANTLNSCNSCNSCGGNDTGFFSDYGINTYSTNGNTLFSNGTNLSCFTQCGRNIDSYYAQQYGLCPTRGCSCGCGN